MVKSPSCTWVPAPGFWLATAKEAVLVLAAGQEAVVRRRADGDRTATHCRHQGSGQEVAGGIDAAGLDVEAVAGGCGIEPIANGAVVRSLRDVGQEGRRVVARVLVVHGA